MKLYPYQVEGIDTIEALEGRAILGDVMGLGKTVQAVKAAERLGAKRILALVSPRFAHVWEKEIERWTDYPITRVRSGKHLHSTLPDEYPGGFLLCGVGIARGTRKDRASGIDNTEALRRMRFDLLIMDEVHRYLRNRKSTTFTNLRRLRTKYILPMSGTLSPRSPALDLWPPLRLVDPKAFSSFWRFVRRFFEIHEGEFGWTIGRCIDEGGLHTLLRRYIIRRTKAEVRSDLPERTIAPVFLDMTPKQRRHYRDVEKGWMTRLSGRKILVKSAIAQTVRLKQICIDPDLMDPEADTIQGPKIDAVLEKIEELDGRPFVLFSQFRRAIERISNRLDAEHVLYVGGNPRNEDNRRTFVRGDVQGFLSTMQCGGEGVDGLQEVCSDALFLDKMWNPADNEQARDRLHRDGQMEPVTIHEFLMNDTIEERIEDLLVRKGFEITRILDGAELAKLLYG